MGGLESGKVCGTVLCKRKRKAFLSAIGFVSGVHQCIHRLDGVINDRESGVGWASASYQG